MWVCVCALSNKRTDFLRNNASRALRRVLPCLWSLVRLLFLLYIEYQGIYNDLLEKVIQKGTKLSCEMCSSDPLGLFDFRSLIWGQLTWNTDAINCLFCYFLKYWVTESGFAMSEFFWHQDPLLWALLGNLVPRMSFWGPQERPLAPIFDSCAWGQVRIQFPATPSIVPEVLPELFFFPPVRVPSVLDGKQFLTGEQ